MYILEIHTGLRATMFIIEINGKQIPDIDSFLECVKTLHDNSPIRLKCRDLDGKLKSYSIKTSEYWPLTEIHFDRQAKKWELMSHSHSAAED